MPGDDRRRRVSVGQEVDARPPGLATHLPAALERFDRTLHDEYYVGTWPQTGQGREVIVSRIVEAGNLRYAVAASSVEYQNVSGAAPGYLTSAMVLLRRTELLPS
jgi:hypothetical protein